MENNIFKGMLLGGAIGDALGVPYEFTPRSLMDKNPATEMIGYGSHNQPVGTWSDDTSLTLCLVASIIQNAPLEDDETTFLHSLAEQFVLWKNENYMGCGDYVFDIGSTTNKAIKNIEKYTNYSSILHKNALLKCGIGNEVTDSLGNGSLMRILPLAGYFAVANLNDDLEYQIVSAVSSLTHSSDLCIDCCYFLVKFGKALIINKFLHQKTKEEVWNDTLEEFKGKPEFDILFNNLIKLNDLNRGEISSSGYVLSTLKASIWSFLQNNDFKSSVLTAVNLGEDTDTVASITGGLAGIFYGSDNIPTEWIELLNKKEIIFKLSETMGILCNG